jgi:outer membrane protein
MMKISHIAMCVALAAGSMAAHAQQNMIRVGIANIQIHSVADPVSSNGPAFLTPSPASVSIGNATTALFAYSRSINDHWDAEIVLGVPPKYNVYGAGTFAPFGVIATVKEAAPTVFAVYNFGSPKDKFRPSVGIGVNYTRFFDGTTTPSGELAAGGPSKITTKDSVGLAVKVGGTYNIDDKWAVIGSIGYADVRTTMTVTTGSIQRSGDVKFNPVAYTLTLGYRF